VPALFAYTACMKTIQYTIRGVPVDWNQQVRREAKRNGKSLNAELLDALRKGLGISDRPRRFTDLDDLAGTWVDDPAFDSAIAEMDQVDKTVWK
jgi:hypothetical protein